MLHLFKLEENTLTDLNPVKLVDPSDQAGSHDVLSLNLQSLHRQSDIVVSSQVCVTRPDRLIDAVSIYLNVLRSRLVELTQLTLQARLEALKL